MIVQPDSAPSMFPPSGISICFNLTVYRSTKTASSETEAALAQCGYSSLPSVEGWREKNRPYLEQAYGKGSTGDVRALVYTGERVSTESMSLLLGLVQRKTAYVARHFKRGIYLLALDRERLTIEIADPRTPNYRSQPLDAYVTEIIWIGEDVMTLSVLVDPVSQVNEDLAVAASHFGSLGVDANTLRGLLAARRDRLKLRGTWPTSDVPHDTLHTLVHALASQVRVLIDGDNSQDGRAGRPFEQAERRDLLRSSRFTIICGCAPNLLSRDEDLARMLTGYAEHAAPSIRDPANIVRTYDLAYASNRRLMVHLNRAVFVWNSPEQGDSNQGVNVRSWLVWGILVGEIVAEANFGQALHARTAQGLMAAEFRIGRMHYGRLSAEVNQLLSLQSRIEDPSSVTSPLLRTLLGRVLEENRTARVLQSEVAGLNIKSRLATERRLELIQWMLIIATALVGSLEVIIYLAQTGRI